MLRSVVRYMNTSVYRKCCFHFNSKELRFRLVVFLNSNSQLYRPYVWRLMTAIDVYVVYRAILF
jgi:hypothetical protein